MRSKQGRGVAEASLTITIFRSEWLLFKFKSKGYWTTGGPSSRLEKKCHALRDSVLSYGGTVENLNTLWGIVWGAKYSFIFWNMNILHVKSIEVSKISAQPHPTLCIQFLNRENNDKVFSGDFCRFCSFYHRCYSVIGRRCQTIKPLLPYSSAHSSACGQKIFFLPSQ